MNYREGNLTYLLSQAGEIPQVENSVHVETSVRERIFELMYMRIPKLSEYQGEIFVLTKGIFDVYDVFFGQDFTMQKFQECEKQRKFESFTRKYIVPEIKSLIDSLLFSDVSDDQVAREIKKFIDFLDARGWYKIFEIAKGELPYLAYWENYTE